MGSVKRAGRVLVKLGKVAGALRGGVVEFWGGKAKRSAERFPPEPPRRRAAGVWGQRPHQLASWAPGFSLDVSSSFFRGKFLPRANCYPQRRLARRRQRGPLQYDVFGSWKRNERRSIYKIGLFRPAALTSGVPFQRVHTRKVKNLAHPRFWVFQAPFICSPSALALIRPVASRQRSTAS